MYVKEGDSDLPEYQLDALSLDEIEPHNPTYTVTGLKDNTHYCFLLKAYATDGFESEFSDEACVLNGQDISINSQDISIESSQGINGGGGSGGGCFISISHDKLSTFIRWFPSVNGPFPQFPACFGTDRRQSHRWRDRWRRH